MNELMEQIKKLPIYLKQPADELIFNMGNKQYITSIMLMFILLEGIARYYTAVWEYKNSSNPDNGNSEDKLERFEDILYLINQDLKINFIKGENNILGKIKEYYFLENDFYEEIKEYFIKYRNKLGHGVFEGLSTEIYNDERVNVVMLTIEGEKLLSTHTTLRKDSILGGYTENLFIPIYDGLLCILNKFINVVK